MTETANSQFVSLSQLAEMLGVSRQRADQIVRDKPDFPATAAETAGGRIWKRAQVAKWIEKNRPDGPQHKWRYDTSNVKPVEEEPG